jgi:uncharacterized protein (TIGR03083 family)
MPIDLLSVLDDEGNALLELAGAGDMTPPVPFCPGWTVQDLVAHLTTIYRWVALIVTERRPERPTPEERAALEPEREPEALLRGFAKAHRLVVDTLTAAPADLDCWTLWPATSSRDFWIRRQAHETLVHRIDVLNAMAGTTLDCADAPADLAADGVDEMVLGFAHRYRERLRSPVPATVALHATDTGQSWWIRIGQGDPEFGRGPSDDAGTRISARAGELMLLLWNRRDAAGLAVTGPDEPLRLWRQSAHL